MSIEDAIVLLDENERQSALVRALGQVECSKILKHREGETCSKCGAAV